MLSHFINVFFVELTFSLFQNNKRLVCFVFFTQRAQLETDAMQLYTFMSDVGLLKQVDMVHKLGLFTPRKDPRNCGPINAFFED